MWRFINHGSVYFYCTLWPALMCHGTFSLSVAATANDPGVSARALAGIADVLAALAGDGTGLRSGPGGNKEWKEAYQQLQVFGDFYFTSDSHLSFFFT